jgi:uncharacterized protein
MPVFERQCTVAATADEAYAWHARPGAFERLLPPWQHVRVQERAQGLEAGRRTVMHVRVGLVSRRWVAVHREDTPGVRFVDEQVEGPFARWVHTHEFVPLDGSSSRLEDHVDYELPLGAAGEMVAGGRIERTLTRLFTFRQRRTRDDLARHGAYRDVAPLRVAISGAGGLIGSELAAFLESGGHEVLRLVRQPPRAAGEVFWDPAARRPPDAAALEGLDAVVHLAGANIAGARWTPTHRRAILESRVDGTSTLAVALAGLKKPPRVLLSASAMGIYGSRGDEDLTEASAVAQGFLPDVAVAWEAASAPARDAGIRTVSLRSSLVVSGKGGAVTAMLPAFKAAVGGPIGGGRQWVSWIALEDWLGAALWLLHADDVDGPVNMAAPQPLTNADMAAVLGKVLRRPAKLPLPAVAVRAGFGEMGERLLLDGARVVPARLLDGGFTFLYPDLESALRAELGLYDR